MRFRISQLIHKILDNLGEDAKIDDDLYDKIYDCMLERLRDKIPIVRMHAVLALTRLQNPRDENCPVIKGIVCLSWEHQLTIEEIWQKLFIIHLLIFSECMHVLSFFFFSNLQHTYF